MAQLLAQLHEMVGDALLAQRLFLLLIAGATFSLAWALLLLLWRPAWRSRLRRLERGTARQHAAGEGAAVGGAWQRQIDRVLQPLLHGPLLRWLHPDTAQQQRLVAQLSAAGFRDPLALHRLLAFKVLLFVLLPLLLLLLLPLLPPIAARWQWAALLLALAVALLLPEWLLRQLLLRRTRQLRDALPDALDLLVVCSEAGLGLKGAIARVATELEVSQPLLASELQRLTLELRAGIDQGEALRRLARRNGVAELESLTHTLLQTLQLGGSIADTLRIYAREFRDRRQQQAEEQAAKLGTQMIFPLVLCLFPAFFLIAAGPAILGALQALQGGV